MRRRWLWALVALITSPAMGLNWTTGQLTHQLNLFLLFGGAAMRGVAASPWIVTFGMPVGAIVAYFRFRAWQRSTVEGAGAPTVAV